MNTAKDEYNLAEGRAREEADRKLAEMTEKMEYYRREYRSLVEDLGYFWDEYCLKGDEDCVG